jgi:2-iminobutanoate/2-iminopropanoate deaminase
MATSKTVLHTDRAPAAVGPYSQGVRASSLIFTAGMIPLDPATGKLVEGDIEPQTRRTLENLKALLEDSKSSLRNVVKTTVFLRNMDDFKRFNAIYAEFFAEECPARSTVEVSRIALDALVEVEAIAFVDEIDG